MATPLVSILDPFTIKLEFRPLPTEWEGLYDRLEVWRSDLGPGGPFFERTGPTYLAAVLPESSGAPMFPGPTVLLDGTTLEVRAGQEDLVFSFVGPDPFTLSSAAAAINAQAHGFLLAQVLEPGILQLQSGALGANAYLEVLGGAAAPALGFSYERPTNTALGRDPRIVLNPARSSFSFVDPRTTRTNHYRTRFRNSFSGLVSEFSPVFTADETTRDLTCHLVRGYLKLVDFQGRPARFQEVLVSNTFQGHVWKDSTILGDSESKKADENGYVEFFLLRGSEVAVALAGTSLVRTIRVPTDPSITSFNLFEPTSALPDVFTVQVPDIPFGARRSL